MSATKSATIPSEETLYGLPPSAKLVVKVLEYNDTLTPSEIASKTLLSPRTVRFALTKLDEIGAIESRFSFMDARRRRSTSSEPRTRMAK